MSDLSGVFELALSNNYMFTTAAPDDFLIRTTSNNQKIMIGTQQGALPVVTITSNALQVNASITAAGYCNLLINSVTSASTSNAATALAVKTAYDAVIALSNAVGSSEGVVFSSNTAIFASNHTVGTSNLLQATSNAMFATAYHACNLAISNSNSMINVSNVLFPQASFASNLVVSSSNVLFPQATYASNLAVTTSNILYPQSVATSNWVIAHSNILFPRSEFASNLAVTSSNALYPMSRFGSNLAVSNSNILFPQAVATSNWVIAHSNILFPRSEYASNLAVTNSNTLYPMSQFGSNLAVSNSNILFPQAVATSNWVIAHSNVLFPRSEFASNVAVMNSNTLYPMSRFASNLAVSNSNILYPTSNLVISHSNVLFPRSEFASNLAVTNSNALYPRSSFGSNLSVANSNYMYPEFSNLSTFTSNTSNIYYPKTEFGSNLAVTASNMVTSLSNALGSTTAVTFSSNAAVFGSNLAVTSSNNLYPPSFFASNQVVTLSNSIRTNPSVTFSSNAAVFGSNVAVFASNIGVYSSNTGVFASNIGVYASNTFLPKAGGTISGTLGIGANVQSTEKLRVAGDIVSTGTITTCNLTVIGDFLTINTTTSNTDQMSITNIGSGPALTVRQDGAFAIAEFYDDSNIALKIDDGGKIGIGKSNPAYALDVIGDVNFTGTLYQNSQLFIGSRWSSNNTLSNIYMTTGRVTIGSNIHEELFNVYNGNAKFASNAYVVQNLGIGLSNPSARLDVNGDARIASNLRVVGNTTLSNATISNLLLVGSSTTTIKQATVANDTFSNALPGDALITGTRILLGPQLTSNAIITVSGSNVSILGSLNVQGALTSTDYSNLLVNSVASTSTSNAPTASALKTAYDLTISLSNSLVSNPSVVFSSNTAVTACNIAIFSSNAAISASNKAISGCNIALAASNTAVSACNIANTASNIGITACNIANFASNVAIAASNTAIGASNIANAASNSAIGACNIANFASNVAIAASNTAIGACNIANFASNVAISASNTAIGACNIANTASNIGISASNKAISGCNIAIAASNTAIGASNIANFASNVAIAASNTAIGACNMSIALSNYISSHPSITFSSNTAVSASNVANDISNLVIALSNYIPDHPSVTWSSNSTNFASNLTVTTSNYTYPKLNATSNAFYVSSNVLFPQALSASNMGVYGSNLARTNSNNLYPAMQFSSNTAVSASNVAIWTSNNALIRSNGGTISAAVTIQSNLAVNAPITTSNNTNVVQINSDGTTYANIELRGTSGAYIDFKDSNEDMDVRIQYLSNERLEFVANTSTNFVFTNGEVGIGTQTPATMLHVYENGATGAQLTLQNSNSGGRAGLKLQSSNISYNIQETPTGNVFFEQVESTTNSVGFYNYGPLLVLDKNNANAERFRINANGNVGIGAITPASRLTVNGNTTIGQAYSNIAAPTNGLLIEGSVGVGTSNPSDKFTLCNGDMRIHGLADPTIHLQSSSATASNAGGIRFEESNSNDGFWMTNDASLGALRVLALNAGQSHKDALAVMSTGRVGINTTNPGATFAVNGNATVGTAYSNASGPTNGLAVQGNVGIGTSNPTAPLHVVGDILHSGNLSFVTTAGTQTWFRAIDTPPTASNFGATIAIGGGAYTILGGGEAAAATITAESNYATTGECNEQVIIASDRAGTSKAIRMVTSIQNGYQNRVEAMTILGDGRIGINNEAPTTTLDIKGHVNISSNLTSSNIFANRMNFQGITVKKAIADQYGVYPFLFPGVSNEEITRHLNIYSSSNVIKFTTSSNEVVRIQESNVGIGTSNPSMPLEVAGNVLFGAGTKANAASPSNLAGGPFFKQQSWDAAGASHTITFPSYCLGENACGTLMLQVSNKLYNINSSKMGTAVVSFSKRYGGNVEIFVIALQRGTNLSTFTVTASGTNIVVTTDVDCSIAWTSMGAY